MSILISLLERLLGLRRPPATRKIRNACGRVRPRLRGEHYDQEVFMKSVKRFALVALVTALTMAGCARSHHAAGSYARGDMGSSLDRGVKEVNALVDRTVQGAEDAKRGQSIVDEIVGEVQQSYRQNSEVQRK